MPERFEFQFLGEPAPGPLERGPELVHRAYDYRTAKYSAEERLGFTSELVNRILMGRFDIYDAKALHIISFTLTGEVPPREAIALLDPPAFELYRRAHEDPEFIRFAALVIRNVSLAANKANNYVAAFLQIERAYRLIPLARRNASSSGSAVDLLIGEALQQICLQASGQFARNVESAIIELDIARRSEMHVHHEAPRRPLPENIRRPLQLLARVSVSTATTASGLVARRFRLNDDRYRLQSAPSADHEHLAVISWLATSNIMLMRALLLRATVDYAAGKRTSDGDPSWLVEQVPALYWQTLTTPGINFQKTHLMDLTRVGLHYSFLAGGQTPHRAPKIKSRRVASTIPDYLASSDDYLDHQTCTDALIRGGHNAGILDNIGFKEVHQVLQTNSRDGGTYERWLRRHRDARLSATGGDVETQLRLASASALDEFQYTTALVPRTFGYADAWATEPERGLL